MLSIYLEWPNTWFFNLHLPPQGGNDLSQRNPAVVRRHALMPIRTKTFRLQTPHRALGEVTILKTTAGKHTRFWPARLATATMPSASALWNLAEITPIGMPLFTSAKIASTMGDQSITSLEFGVRSSELVSPSFAFLFRNPHSAIRTG